MSTLLPTGGDRAAAIASDLIAEITAGQYPPGARLPSEAALCAHYDVSRSSVREALGRLAALELITTRRGAGGGAFVTTPSPAALTGRLQTLLALSGAEADVLRVARQGLVQTCAARLDPDRRAGVDLRAEIDLQSDFALPDDGFLASRQRLLTQLVSVCDNALLVAMAQALIAADLGRARGEVTPTRMRARFLSYHVRIANALATGRSDDLLQALAELSAFESELANAPAEAPAPERPPRMRDLPRPRVQRLGDTGQ